MAMEVTIIVNYDPIYMIFSMTISQEREALSEEGLEVPFCCTKKEEQAE
jgi:hypothetical protein